MQSGAFQKLDWYEHPAYYDLLLEQDTQAEADFIEALLELHGLGSKARLLEPACGSGRLVVELARRGYRLTGFDLSQSMLDFAAKRLAEEGLQAALFKASMEDFELKGRVDLVYCLLSSFRYLMDDESALAHLTRAAKALTKGGIYLLGLHLTEYAFKGTQQERWVAKREDLQVVCNLRSWPAMRKERLERLRSRITATDLSSHGAARVTDKFETQWNFRCYDAKQLKSLLNKLPCLELVATHDFHYDLDQRRRLDDKYLDKLLVLKKR